EDAGTLNFLGWIRATCLLAELRDGTQALRDATRACELTDYQVPGYLDTLAAAHAEAGPFEDADRWHEQAIKRVDADSRAEYGTRLGWYRRGEPCRDREPGAGD